MATIDFRSDTVAMPSPEMRRAMVEAPLGDDVFGDDPTTNKLMEVAAERMGKEAATFVPSGTMGNLIGIAVNAQRGEEMIADAESHAFWYETAGAAAVCGVQIRPIATGIAWPLEDLRAARDAAHAKGLRVHLDGARIFNASVALGVDSREIAGCADTVTFCLSKGLACPIGSIFCGSEESVEEARRWRKRLGGGMRQVGVLAAAGLIALDQMVDRLAEDHANARTLAEGLSELPGVRCDLRRVQTNLVYFDLENMSAPEFTDACARRGLLSDYMGPRRMRFVTHYGIDAGDIQSALKICEEVLSA